MKNRAHVLVVEDDPDLQALLAQLLEGENYTLSCASNGKQALELLQSMKELPSFILLDVMMPVMNGFEFRKAQLRDVRLASVPVVVMTADSEPKSKAEEMGVSNIITKPISVDRLLSVAASFT